MADRPLLHVVSMSGGKDSTATALVCRETQPAHSIRYVFADTGNEHEATYEYLDYLERQLGIQITRLKRDLTPEWEHRRQWLMSDAPRKGNARRPARSEEEIARVLRVFEQGPTGNPFLDLCIIKGRFPSRLVAFCTQFLKLDVIIEYQLGLHDEGYDVWSWQGIRRDESNTRKWAPEFEEVGRGFWIHRPIARWTALDTFEAMRACDVLPNPLYTHGMSRVGCMPCINVGKDELAEIARRFPRHIDRIRQWEEVVALASWRQDATFIPAPTKDGRGARQGHGIDAVVRWAKTSRGGRQFDLLKLAPAEACSSAYGLCE